MKHLLILCIAMVLSISCYSQNSYQTNNKGQTIIVNQYGQLVATRTLDVYGNVLWVDPQGRVLKKEERGGSNTTTIQPHNANKDVYDRYHKDSQGNTVVENGQGQDTYIYKKNIQGNTEVYDTNGRLLGVYKTDYNGTKFYPNY